MPARLGVLTARCRRVTASAPSSHADPVKVVRLIRAFQDGGHRIATLDPLGLGDADLDDTVPPELNVSSYFSPDELSLPVHLSADGAQQAGMIGGFASQAGMTVADLCRRLHQTYASTVGVEFAHLDCRVQRDWLCDQLETPSPVSLSASEQRRALEKLCWASNLEAFLNKSFPTTKRFGLEGCESMIVGLDMLMAHASQSGVQHVIMGMPHRGRLNVLANVLHKPLEAILCEFRGSGVGTPADAELLRERSSRIFAQFDVDGNAQLDMDELHAALSLLGVDAAVEELIETLNVFDIDGSCTLDADEFHNLAVRLLSKGFSGDAKYHLGTVCTRHDLAGGLTIKLLPNPSHLEAVNPLVMGAVRAKQRTVADHSRRQVLPVLIHGDAAFSGQGVVAETLGLSDLHGYTTGWCYIYIYIAIDIYTDIDRYRYRYISDLHGYTTGWFCIYSKIAYYLFDLLCDRSMYFCIGL